MDYKYLRDTYYRYLRYFLAKDETTATTYDKYMALAYAVRSEMVDRWIKTQKSYHVEYPRRVYYLSMEYIFGKSLYQNMVNLGIEQPLTSAVRSLGFSIRELLAKEDDFELGNGGKGRIAACLMESMATQGVPAMGYGLRYDYAQFQQEMKNGVQIEKPNDWLHRGHPWEIVRPEYGCVVNFEGECRRLDESNPLGPYEWTGTEIVHAVPYDVPVVGYKNETVNTLRLWSARPSEEFLPDYFNHKDYVRACEEKSQSGRITKVLFPEEDVRRAHELRIRQQYFFVSSVIQDIIRRHKAHHDNILDLESKIVIQLAGSRCALAIPEMMRILVDKEGVEWKKAWEMTRNIFAYTSNAVLRDHLEMWPVYKIGQTLPRIMQIIYDINQMHLDTIRTRYGNNTELLRTLSLIEEGEVKRIRFADLAVLGSHSINGVSMAQTDLLQKIIFPHFSLYYPEKFSCKTNGVAHRRWLLCANRPLSDLISSTIGDGWIRNALELEKLEKFSDDRSLHKDFKSVKEKAKSVLCKSMWDYLSIRLDETMLFDIQSRRIHPSKRQVLHILFILHRYLQLKNGQSVGSRRLHLFAGKASPSDFLAKQIIHLINVTGDLVNSDPDVKDKLQVEFIPNFGMTWADEVIPAAELSEQISTANLEASGTFNMKFAFNGALTIASRSGSNVEMIQKVGEDNIFAFGKSSDELLKMQHYNPAAVISGDTRLQNIFTLLDTYLPTVKVGNAIYPLISSLRDSDRQYVLLDFDDYVRKQDAIDELYQNSEAWAKKSLLNIARIGWFSSDRTVRDYAQNIWKVTV
ncbi:MAG: glycogen/starch/alpha-glucan family phosphorylase [Chitinispirillaceae bacterium]